MNRAVSSLRQSPDGALLSLVAMQGNGQRETKFLTARAVAPEITARGLRVVSEIVGARFYVPPSMLQRIIREADPVATVGSNAVRFEGLSACCSAYARLDIDDTGLETTHRHKGTTNVDFGPTMRATLAQIRPETSLSMTIGAEAVEIAAGDSAAVTEEKVPLPIRWIKGLGEAQRVMAEMTPAFRMDRIAAQRLLHQLPRSGNSGKVWVGQAERRPRVTAREAPGSVPLNGPHRLRALEILLPKAASIEVFVNSRSEATAWMLNCEHQRLTLVLNGDPWRGFSGDGGLLSQIVTSSQNAVAVVRAQLDWQPAINPASMAKTTGLGEEQVETALGHLAAMGLVGFDLERQAYFHRVLPFDLDRIERLNPRLKSAQALVRDGAVEFTEFGASVSSGGVVHRVSAHDDGWRCTCPWFSKNGNLRGPCKHILSVEMEMERAK